MYILQTERLRLRAITEDDAPFYLELVNDPAFVEHIGDRGIGTLDEARRAVIEGPAAMQASLGHSLYVVELIEGAVAIGMCGLIKRDALADVDIGYAFLPAYRGLGYAFEAARAVLAWAAGIGIARVAAITSPDNIASNQLLLKLGLKFQCFTHLRPGDPGTNLYLCELAPAMLQSAPDPGP
jgi:RimJ/RimL family protein N-acetyltransferase